MSITAFRTLPTDLGFEPPLSTEGGDAPAVLEGAKLNIRWLAGIILTGVGGAGLLFLSVAGALAPLRKAVTPPQVIKSSRDDRPIQGGTYIAARRGDKLVRKANLVAARQDYRAPMQVRVGAAEVTKQASFTRLSSPLALTTLGFADSIPAFNLAKLVSMASEERQATEGDGAFVPDSEVNLSLRDIGVASGLPVSPIMLADEDALAQVFDILSEKRRDTAQVQLARVMRAPAVAESTTATAFAAGVGDPFSKLVVKMVAENVSHIPRQESVLSQLGIEERIFVSRNEAATLQVLRNNGASAAQAKEIVSAVTRGGKAANLEGNRILKLSLQAPEPGAAKELMRVELFADEQLVASTGRKDDGSFWPIEINDVAPAAKVAKAEESDEDSEEETDTTRLSLYASIHETARRHDIPQPVIDEIIRAVFFDVDLQRRVNSGDSMEVLMANGDTEGAKPEPLLISLNAQGVKRRYFRFKLPEDEVVDYFDDQGRSVKQFLLRKPMDGGIFRSAFGMRRHPIVRTYRMHSGVDWAGPVGTPIRAAGNGRVRLAEWDSGYGRRVEIEHNHGYVTTYSHLSAFGPGIKEGVQVRQGQIIGRLGSSGLSTGPHLHYEVLINERFVDPLAIRLPKGRELAGQQLNNFKRERDFVETVLKAAPGASSRVAQN